MLAPSFRLLGRLTGTVLIDARRKADELSYNTASRYLYEDDAHILPPAQAVGAPHQPAGAAGY